MVHCDTNTSPEPSAYGEQKIVDWDVSHHLKQTKVKEPEGIVLLARWFTLYAIQFDIKNV